MSLPRVSFCALSAPDAAGASVKPAKTSPPSGSVQKSWMLSSPSVFTRSTAVSAKAAGQSRETHRHSSSAHRRSFVFFRNFFISSFSFPGLFAR